MKQQQHANLTIIEAAEELSVSPHTIRAWIGRRRLGHLKLGRSIRIPHSEVLRLIERSFVPASPER